jgi:hypothetical protein
MAEDTSRQQWIDRYVRNELTVEEIAEFELALMESPQMQKGLETVLGLREALLLEPEPGQQTAVDDLLPESLSGGGNWRSLAMVASVLLAVFSTVMFWKVSNDSAALQNQLDLLSQPRTVLLTVPVNIMRSASSQEPDVIVKIPTGHSAMMLDIELNPASRQQQSLGFALLDEAGMAVLKWSATAGPDGHVEALLNSEQVPASRLWLEISSEDGQVLDRRLLEFR